MGKIYITRHGETEWNVERRMQGHYNSPLTELGLKQAKWLHNRIAHVPLDVIYSSPLERAYETAKIVRGARRVSIIKCEALKEIYLGTWQGMLIADVKEKYGVQHNNFWYNPEEFEHDTAESFESLTKRIGTFFDEVSRKDENILMVAHGVVLKALINYITNNGIIDTFWEGPPIGQTSLTIINTDTHEYKIELLADTSHHKSGNKHGSWFVDED